MFSDIDFMNMNNGFVNSSGTDLTQVGAFSEIYFNPPRFGEPRHESGGPPQLGGI